MKQFKQLVWIQQALLGLVLLSAMSHSDAMSVRERYLQEHPAEKTENAPEKEASAKESTHHKKHHQSEKHSSKEQSHSSKHHRNAEHSRHHKIDQPKHHQVDQPIEKHVHSHHKAKEHHERVAAPKLAPSKFDSQQARDAEEALHHEPVKQEAPVKRAYGHHAATEAPIRKHHAAHHVTRHPVKSAHHHRHHHAE